MLSPVDILTCTLLGIMPFVMGLTSPLPAITGPRTFDLTLTWQKAAPDGVSRDMLLVNGQYPGPLLEINQGEEVWILVHNLSPYNTTMHYHGTNFWTPVM
jgi:FtsP/CotA-like multicopper oxidase with cupredoxin domain